LAISSKNIASLLDFTVQGVGKWKKENIQNNKRKIISLLEKYFIDEDIVEFLQTGKISRLENHETSANYLLIDYVRYVLFDKLDKYFFEPRYDDNAELKWKLHIIPKRVFLNILKHIENQPKLEVEPYKAKEFLLETIKIWKKEHTVTKENETKTFNIDFSKEKEWLISIISNDFSIVECYALIKYADDYLK
jgi:hypothetical protein